jgi:hypothetical protein
MDFILSIGHFDIGEIYRKMPSLIVEFVKVRIETSL